MKINNDAGFSLFEITVVLIVMGIITGFAIGRGAIGGPDLDIQTEVLKTHLRHAQSRAMNSNIHWGIRTDAGGGSYWLFKYDGSITTVRLPGEGADTVNISTDGISMSAGTYSFDSRGVPYYAGHSDTPPGTSLAGLGGNLSISISDGSDTNTITITQNTGFIP